jgi:hypothetical protein
LVLKITHYTSCIQVRNLSFSSLLNADLSPLRIGNITQKLDRTFIGLSLLAAFGCEIPTLDLSVQQLRERLYRGAVRHPNHYASNGSSCRCGQRRGDWVGRRMYVHKADTVRIRDFSSTEAVLWACRAAGGSGCFQNPCMEADLFLALGFFGLIGRVDMGPLLAALSSYTPSSHTTRMNLH